MHADAANADELIASLQSQLAAAHELIASRDVQLNQKAARIELLEAQLLALKRSLFGRRSEQLSPDQLSLWRADRREDQAELEAELEGLLPVVTPAEKPQHPKRPIELPRKLPRTTETLDVDTTCTGCGHTLHRIGEERTQTVEWIPGHAEVKELLRPKYACRTCETITVAPLPARVNAKGILGDSVVAQVLVSKYADHLPLHRQRGIFKRSGVDIAESTLGDVVGRAGLALKPLAERLAALITTGGKLHADDTPITVLVPEGERTVRKEGRFWVYHRDRSLHDPPLPPMVVFTFSASREGKHPQAFLKDFKGYLQADAYGGFAALFDGGIQEVACWAHARRPFEALQTSPIAREVLFRIGELYRIEKELKGQPIITIEERRKAEALPILLELKVYLDARLMELSQTSPLAKAIGYITRRWASFCRYVEHGALSIDNNAAERQIRPIAAGRNNWNLVGSIAAGERSATLYSLIGTCKLNGIEPWAYLTDVLARLPTQLAKNIDELLPMNWQPLPKSP